MRVTVNVNGPLSDLRHNLLELLGVTPGGDGLSATTATMEVDGLWKSMTKVEMMIRDLTTSVDFLYERVGQLSTLLQHGSHSTTEPTSNRRGRGGRRQEAAPPAEAQAGAQTDESNRPPDGKADGDLAPPAREDGPAGNEGIEATSIAVEAEGDAVPLPEVEENVAESSAPTSPAEPTTTSAIHENKARLLTPTEAAYVESKFKAAGLDVAEQIKTLSGLGLPLDSSRWTLGEMEDFFSTHLPAIIARRSAQGGANA